MSVCQIDGYLAMLPRVGLASQSLSQPPLDFARMEQLAAPFMAAAAAAASGATAAAGSCNRRLALTGLSCGTPLGLPPTAVEWFVAKEACASQTMWSSPTGQDTATEFQAAQFIQNTAPGHKRKERGTDELLTVNGGIGTVTDTNNDNAKKIRMEKAAAQNNNNNNLVTANNNNTTTANNNTNTTNASVNNTSSTNLNNNNNGSGVQATSPAQTTAGAGSPATSPPHASRVVHLRNVPNDATDTEILQLGIPFGKITNILQLRGKNQAFLEMESEASAAQMVEYFGKTSSQLRGRTIYAQHSNHRELKVNDNSVGNSMLLNSTQVALAAAQALMGLQQQHGLSPRTNGDIAGDLSPTHNAVGTGNTVLRAMIENQVYPVSLELLHNIFSRIGKVLKIVTFNKNNTFQALVQFSDAMAAQAAKMTLDGQHIYNGCCTLRIEYSKLQQLNVKYNNDKSRDFTNPSLPTGDPALDTLGLANPLGMLHSPFAGLSSHLSAAFGTQGLQGLPNMQSLPGLGSFALNPAAQALGVAGLRLPGNPQSCVLLVSNLNEQTVTPDALFTLFGVYGDVIRVKILFNKKDSALIQMAEPQQAQLAMTHLDKIKLFGKQLRVTPSKHHMVQLPKEGQPDAGLTKDYISSSLHRFKKPGSKNYQNIYPPSATLHLSNIPPTCSEEQIRESFTSLGCGNIVAFKFFPKDRKMALLQLPSIEEAVIALIKMHNFQLSDSSHLRVSFSKSTI
ncbi:polypyrimidine tract-binding protein 3-like isoform X2 [Varroa destructor]|uniref:RRM domain-containing protein n=1 Tax=Varroa destructor TaxID=109461 RepID=A0A7M7JW30_VARDE|nr:polypyrimidine tract-binding protein 3-like isoform X2 [Varroa destructor]